EMRRRRAGRRKVREVFVARRDLARLLDPVLAERALQAVDDRPFEPQAGVAPMLSVLSVPGPLLGESVAADVADTPVDDCFLAMIAIVEASPISEGRLVILDQLHAGAGHHLRQLPLHSAAAGSVGEEANFDPLLRFR